MPHFKSIKFYQNRPKIKLFLQKNTKVFPQIPETGSFQLQISGFVPQSNHVFALLISMPPEFSLMPLFTSINFHQNKQKISFANYKIFSSAGVSAPRPPNGLWWMGLELPDPQNTLSPYCRFLVMHPISDTKRVLLSAHTSKV